eukprot:9302211-Prorocentrum_lima.AAC.1
MKHKTKVPALELPQGRSSTFRDKKNHWNLGSGCGSKTWNIGFRSTKSMDEHRYTCKTEA